MFSPTKILNGISKIFRAPFSIEFRVFRDATSAIIAREKYREGASYYCSTDGVACERLAKAASCFREAGEMGDAQAWVALGLLYADGMVEGGAQPGEATVCYNRATALGYPPLLCPS